MVWEPRHYRRRVASPELVAFEVVVAETDLQILATERLEREAQECVVSLRRDLEGYISAHPRFAESFVPVPVEADAPHVVREMAQAAEKAGVGPMAAVAGAFAESVARRIAAVTAEVIVENGGDVFLATVSDRVVGLWAGDGMPRSLGLRVPATLQPVAIATSSGTIGPSVSLGSADSATVVAASGALADAAASVLGNRIHGEGDLEAALEAVRRAPGVLGAVATVAGSIGAWGAIELVPIESL